MSHRSFFLSAIAAAAFAAAPATAGTAAAASDSDAPASSTSKPASPKAGSAKAGSAKAGSRTGGSRAQVPRRQVGKASIYANMFAGRKMANGKRMDPKDDNAASKTLPLGTKALVHNLETGKSTVVTIEDRGPYVRGRIVDLSPQSAEQIGLSKKQGLAPVEVTPLEVPGEDSSVASAR